MAVTTAQAVRVGAPVPPACVTDYATQTAVERAHDARQAELAAEALKPAVDALLGRYDIYTVARAVELLLGQKTAGGAQMLCSVSLREQSTAPGWFY